jgi:hypothetical protein
MLDASRCFLGSPTAGRGQNGLPVLIGNGAANASSLLTAAPLSPILLLHMMSHATSAMHKRTVVKRLRLAGAVCRHVS